MELAYRAVSACIASSCKSALYAAKPINDIVSGNRTAMRPAYISDAVWNAFKTGYPC